MRPVLVFVTVAIVVASPRIPLSLSRVLSALVSPELLGSSPVALPGLSAPALELPDLLSASFERGVMATVTPLLVLVPVSL